MKRLSDFKDSDAIIVVAKLLPPIMEMLVDPENKKLKDEKNGFKMFSGFFKNSPDKMMEIFAVLSECDPEDYHCDGVDVIQNIMTLANDERLVELFTSQGQKGDATSSGSALENSEA